MRVLLWLVLGVLVIFALRKKSQRPANPVNPASMPTGPVNSNDAGLAEAMLCCERCKIYFPASEAVMRGDKVFCCSAHADQT